MYNTNETGRDKMIKVGDIPVEIHVLLKIYINTQTVLKVTLV